MSSSLLAELKLIDLNQGSGMMKTLLRMPIIGKMFEYLAHHPGVAAAIVAAIIIAIAIFMHTKSPEEQAVEDIAKVSVWVNSGKVLSMAATSAFFSMAYNLDHPITSLADHGIPSPTIQLRNSRMQSLTNADGSAFTDKSIPYDTPIVVTNADGTQSVYVISRGGVKNGQAVDNVKRYNLNKNMVFRKPTSPNQGFVPFLVNGQVNPAAVTAVNDQRNLLQATPYLTAAEKAAAAARASVMDKGDVMVNP